MPSDLSDSFVVQMLKDWESSAREVGTSHGCRVSCLRIGIALGTDGGMMQSVKWQYFFGKALEMIFANARKFRMNLAMR